MLLFLVMLIVVFVVSYIFFQSLYEHRTHQQYGGRELSVPQLQQLLEEARQKLLQIPPEELKDFDLCAYEQQLVEKHHISSELSRDTANFSGFLNHKGCLMYLQLLPLMADDPEALFDRINIKKEADPFIIRLASDYKVNPMDAFFIFCHASYIVIGYRHELLKRKVEEANHPELLNDPLWLSRPAEHRQIIHDFVTGALADGTLHPICNWGRRTDDQSSSAYRVSKRLQVEDGYAFFLIQEDLEARGLSIVPAAPCLDPVIEIK